jgi:hypothetical protein
VHTPHAWCSDRQLCVIITTRLPFPAGSMTFFGSGGGVGWGGKEFELKAS